MPYIFGVKYSPSKTCPKWPPQFEHIISIRCPSASISVIAPGNSSSNMANRNSNETYQCLVKRLVTLFACVEAVLCEMISVFSKNGLSMPFRKITHFSSSFNLFITVLSTKIERFARKKILSRKMPNLPPFIDFLNGACP